MEKENWTEMASGRTTYNLLIVTVIYNLLIAKADRFLDLVVGNTWKISPEFLFSFFKSLLLSSKLKCIVAI